MGNELRIVDRIEFHKRSLRLEEEKMHHFKTDGDVRLLQMSWKDVPLEFAIYRNEVYIRQGDLIGSCERTAALKNNITYKLSPYDSAKNQIVKGRLDKYFYFKGHHLNGRKSPCWFVHVEEVIAYLNTHGESKNRESFLTQVKEIIYPQIKPLMEQPKPELNIDLTELITAVEQNRITAERGLTESRMIMDRLAVLEDKVDKILNFFEIEIDDSSKNSAVEAA